MCVAFFLTRWQHARSSAIPVSSYLTAVHLISNPCNQLSELYTSPVQTQHHCGTHIRILQPVDAHHFNSTCNVLLCLLLGRPQGDIDKWTTVLYPAWYRTPVKVTRREICEYFPEKTINILIRNRRFLCLSNIPTIDYPRVTLGGRITIDTNRRLLVLIIDHNPCLLNSFFNPRSYLTENRPSRLYKPV